MTKLLLFLSCAAMFAACGSGEDAPATDRAMRAESPQCGSDCPTNCWGEIHNIQSGKELRVWIFSANHIDPASAISNGVQKLEGDSSSTSFVYTGQVPSPVPSTLEVHWNIPSGFNTNQSNLSTRFLPDGLDDQKCGMP